MTKSYTYTPGGLRLSQIIHNSDATITSGYYTYNDHSDVEAVTSASGTTTATYGYTAYGQNDTTQFTGADKPASQQPSTQPFNAYRFNAMRWDSTTTQYDMGFRTYDPGLSQFLTRDMYSGALADMDLDTDAFTGNRYTFGAGNPVSSIEIDGHTQCDAGICPTSTQTDQVKNLQNGTYNPYKPVSFTPEGIAAGIKARNEAAFERALAAAQAAYNRKYGPGSAPDLSGCSAGPGGSVDLFNCGANKSIAVVTLLHYLCSQPGITCTGPAAHGNPMAYVAAIGVAGGMIYGEGPRGEGVSCGGESFTRGTRVLLANGKTVRISQLRPGSKVRATDPATGKTGPQTVAKVWVNHDADLMDVTVRSGGKTSIVHATQHHLFWDDTHHRWVEARQLERGDRLAADDGEAAVVIAVAAVSGAAEMWDLTVSTDHDFYVGTASTAILAHNCPVADVGGSRRPWQLTREGALGVVRGGPFNTTFYKSASDGTWWTTDVAGHGGSAFKVYEETAQGLQWIADADKYGNYLTGKWKGGTGQFIPWSSLHGG